MTRKNIWWGIVLTITVWGLAPGVSAAKNGHTNKGTYNPIPVNVIFRDCIGPGTSPLPSYLALNSDATCGQQDLVQWDGMGGYVGEYRDGDAGVSAVIEEKNGQLRLEMSSDDLRGLFMDFSSCASGAGTCTPTSQIAETDNIYHWARLTMGGQLQPDGLLGMAIDPTASVSVAMRIVLWDGVKNGDSWEVYFDPNAGRRNPCQDPNHQGNFVNVTRTSATQWVATFDSNEVACMSGANGTTGFFGTYHLPLQFVITEQ